MHGAMLYVDLFRDDDRRIFLRRINSSAGNDETIMLAERELARATPGDARAIEVIDETGAILAVGQKRRRVEISRAD